MDDNTLHRTLGGIEAKLDTLLSDFAKRDEDKEGRLRALEQNQWKWSGITVAFSGLLAFFPFDRLVKLFTGTTH
jgi:hypothetical protein